MMLWDFIFSEYIVIIIMFFFYKNFYFYIMWCIRKYLNELWWMLVRIELNKIVYILD